MRKISLKKNSGFNLSYEDGDIIFDNVVYSKNKVVSLDNIRAQLLNEDLQSPEVFYKKYSNLDIDDIYKKKKIKINLISIPQNIAGIEYVKTKAVQCSTHNKVIEIVSGGGLVLLQKFSRIKGESDISIIKVKNSDKIVIPAKHTYCLVNNRVTPLIVMEFMPLKAKNKLVLDEMGGMAYYVIRKNAKQEIVRNPLYKIVNIHKKFDWSQHYKKSNITPKTPFSRQVLRKYEKFAWLFIPAKDSTLSFNF